MQKNNEKINALIQYFKETFSLGLVEIESLLEADINEFKKGEIILKEGQQSEKCFFVIKGCVRQYYIDYEGKEITVNFYTKFQPIAIETSKDKSNPYYLECMEDTFMTTDESERTETLYQSFPNIESISRQITEQNLTTTQERMTKLLAMKPEDRYLDLINTKPELVQRVPQHHIASYLGIQPESLSRIKKRLADKRNK